MKRLGVLAALAVLVVLAVGALVWPRSDRRAGEVLDEARMAGRDAASFRHASEDYFHDMDGAVSLTEDEVKGRNMWLVWTGGNDRFWDGMGKPTFGAFDLLKIVAPPPEPEDGPARRAGTRWAWSTSLASTRRCRTAIRRASACGSTCGAPTARPIRSRTSRNIRA